MQHHPRARHRRTAASTAILALLGLTALTACESGKQEPAKPSAEAEKASAPKPAAAPSKNPKPATVKRLEWDDPKEWKTVGASGMRAASYQIPPAAGDKEIAELNVFVLGGDIESNIQRWINEFSDYDAKALARIDRSVNDMTQAVVEIPKGTFNGGMSNRDLSPNFGLLGAIVVTPEDSKYFFKLTGPSATVAQAREPFYRLLDSVRLEGGTAAPDSAKTIKAVGGPASSVGAAGASGTTQPASTTPSAAPAAKP